MVEVINEDTPFKVFFFIFCAIGWLLALSGFAIKDKNR